MKEYLEFFSARQRTFFGLSDSYEWILNLGTGTIERSNLSVQSYLSEGILSALNLKGRKGQGYLMFAIFVESSTQTASVRPPLVLNIIDC